MKNTAIKFLSVIFFLFSSLSALAQNPEEVPEDLDGTPAPISDHIWVLALVGLTYVFLKYSPKLTKRNS